MQSPTPSSQSPAEQMVALAKALKPEDRVTVVGHPTAKQLEQGVLVEQDAQDKSDLGSDVFYFIGKGLAYTSRIHTCTALALYHQPSCLAYLSHADSLTDASVIAQKLKEYMGQVGDDFFDPQKTKITLFFAQDTLDSSRNLKGVSLCSVAPIMKAFTLAVKPGKLQSCFSTITYQLIGPSSIVFVGNNCPPSVIVDKTDLIQHLKMLAQQYMSPLADDMQRHKVGLRLFLLLPMASEIQDDDMPYYSSIKELLLDEQFINLIKAIKKRQLQLLEEQRRHEGKHDALLGGVQTIESLQMARAEILLSLNALQLASEARVLYWRIVDIYISFGMAMLVEDL